MTRWTSRVFLAGMISIVLVACGVKNPSEPKTVSNISGIVTVPLEGARVYIYEEGDDIYSAARVISEPTGPDGAYSVTLRPGKYVAVVRMRRSGEMTGPVKIGDFHSEPITIDVAGSSPGVLNFSAFVKTGNDKVFPSRSVLGDTGISGTIYDADENPAEGLRVNVYEHIQMSERPKYVSAKTGPDGRYKVSVKRGGTYYIAARDRFGGPPQLGDLYGRYDEGTVDPSGVVVRKGEILENVDVTVHRVW